MANTQISMTQSAGTSAKKFTVSMWWKPGTVDTNQGLWGCGTGTSDAVSITYQSGGQLSLETFDGSLNPKLRTTRVFRDPAAWYHLVFSIDTTDSSASERLKIWINGVEETVFITDTTITQDSDIPGWSGSGDTMKIGNRILDGDAYFDGEMSHVHVIDGTIYGASTFGETDSTSGIWKINTAPTVTYGTNGCFLKMEDRTNLDLDSSPNAHTMTTAGTLTATYDNPSDNFCTLNPIQMSDPSANYILSQGNNTLNVTSNDYMRQTGMTIHPTGLKGYFEFKNVADSNYQVQFQDVTVKLGKENYNDLASSEMYFLTWGDLKFSNGGSAGELTAAYFGSPGAAQGDIIGCAFDFTGSNRNVWFHRNGTYGNNGSGVGNPSTGAYPAFTSSLLLTTKEYEIIFAANSGTTCTTAFNFGNGYFGTTAISSEGTNASGIGAFEYDVPTGFTALSTKGLNE